MNESSDLTPAPVTDAPRSPGWLNRTVAGAGITSALGDFCYETTTVILPGFLAVLGIPAAGLGFIEGAADALANFTKMVSGYIADKLGHRKLLVIAGYALTPVGQCFIALAAGWPLLLTGRLVSWFGKGLRGPLRDAIVIQAVSPGTRARAFGFHRAMDTVGAVLGPLLGVAVLGWARQGQWTDAAGPFRLVLWLSVIPGLLAVLAFLFLVKDPAHSPNPAMRFFSTLRGLPLGFRSYLGAVGLFGLGDFSHSLMILAATDLLSPTMGTVKAAQVAGLFYVGRNVVQVFASYGVGLLADRMGSRPVLVGGYWFGVATAVALIVACVLKLAGFWMLGLIFMLGGLSAAIQDTLESTITAEFVDGARLATSYGALGTVNGAAKFASSAVVGLLWTTIAPAAGFGLAALLMTAGTIAIGFAFRTGQQRGDSSSSTEENHG